ncbi:Glycosyl transferase, family 20 [Artemisia annua]|uniref:Glycosyl transferase, family 20 n=1 Tax=Artemisia annua TaxID=35608 RepID=A0A2U1NBI9_ARTAN|nr:Glycosyl transferase, family 20 [Artemisia annua]
MPGNKYNGNSSVPTSRIERLLRERKLRKNSKASYTNDAGGNDAFKYGDNLVEQYLEGASAARDGWEKPDGGLFTQRLLVVANRLPVSAVRRGEESWSLEVSAGGLVSALLGCIH